MPSKKRQVNPGERYGSMVIVNEQKSQMIGETMRRMFLLHCDCGRNSVKSIHALRRIRSCSYTCPYRNHVGRTVTFKNTVYTPAQLEAFASEWKYRDH